MTRPRIEPSPPVQKQTENESSSNVLKQTNKGIWFRKILQLKQNKSFRMNRPSLEARPSVQKRIEIQSSIQIQRQFVLWRFRFMTRRIDKVKPPFAVCELRSVALLFDALCSEVHWNAIMINMLLFGCCLKKLRNLFFNAKTLKLLQLKTSNLERNSHSIVSCVQQNYFHLKAMQTIKISRHSRGLTRPRIEPSSETNRK